ncbi:MAG TPA: Crp/Fnr family transcriptional regulator [Gemmatimonadaceae bacterium]|nr:Crp/Fnr family transcriptional regulator [Gemmatimonadaceae bacterium]
MTDPRGAGTKVPAGLLAELPGPAARTLLAGAGECRFAADEVLYLAGTPAAGLFIVLEGEVRVLRAGGGRPHVLHTEGPGGTLGEVPLFEGTTYPATAIAAEPTRCLVLTRDAVRAAVRADPDVAFALLRRLAARVRLLVERLDQRAGHPTLGRLAALVLARHRAAGGAPFALARSQQEAAEELGTVRELVVRGLRELRARGALRAVGRGRYVVADEGALRTLAGDALSG